MSALPSPFLPAEAEIVERIDESRDIFTLRLRLTDEAAHEAYTFAPGQFNMLYLHGVGEVAISIVSDPEHGGTLDHTIRALGRVTKGLAALKPGQHIGIRGPYGRGCAPLVSVINYVVLRRERYRKLCIVQGVKHSADLIWRERYEQWAELPDTRVLLAADRGSAEWRWHVGLVTDLLQDVDIEAANGIAMMCGPEAMMNAAARSLMTRGFEAGQLHLSMERNMHCAVAQCGHCQFGADFVCRDGPVFSYDRIARLLPVKGF